MAEINDLNIVDDSNIARFPEGQSAASVNNGARALEGLIARWDKDTNASITAGGTGDVITVAANQTLTAYYDGLVIAFSGANTCTGGGVTLNVDGLGAKNLYKLGSTALAASDIVPGQKVIAIYDGTNFQIVSLLQDLSSSAAAAASAAAALVSENAAAADLVLTNADVVTTNADAVSTGNDVIATNADVVLTNADVVTTAGYVDTFDDRYLGSKTSDPTLDNDGNPLTDGALYFDTTLNAMKVYDLGTTAWLRMTPTASDQADITTVSGISADVTTVAGDTVAINAVAGMETDIANVVDFLGWDLTNTAYESKQYGTGTQVGTHVATQFKPNGLSMYVLDNDASEDVFQYTLSTAWDVTTATYASKTVNITAQGVAPNSFFMSPDGTKMFTVDGIGLAAFQYTLSTAWDISSASYASKTKDVSAEIGANGANDITFSADGTKMYVTDNQANDIFQYTLSTPWDISTASYASKTLDLSTQVTNVRGIVFSANGLKLFCGEQNASTDSVFEYDCGTAWDISTAVYSGNSITTNGTKTTGITFSADGTQMYVSDSNTASAGFVDQYTSGLSSADISTVAGISSDVSVVSGINTDVTTVSGVSANVTTVAGISANVTTVAGVSANVTTVAGISADVTSVAAIDTDVTTVAAIPSADITAVAAIPSSEITAVASQVIGWNFSTTTAMADPGAGIIRFNNATPASVTAIAVDDLDSNAADVSAYVISWDDSTNTNKGTLTVRQGTSFATFTITALTDNAGWTQLAVTYVTGSGVFSDATLSFAGFTRSGDKGLDGAGSGDLLAANNLSDVASAPTSLSNIGGIGAATTDTLTNKTFDANGTGNSVSNIDVADLSNGTDGELVTWDAAGAPTTVATGTATHVLTSNGAGAAPTFQAAAGGGIGGFNGTNILISSDDSAGALITTGGNNILLGTSAGNNLTGGNNNIIMGLYSGLNLTNSSGCVILGPEALGSGVATGANDIVTIGQFSGFALTTGDNNVFIGRSAGSAVTTGTNLVALGHMANPTSATATNEITLGNSSIATLRCQVTSITALSDERDKANITDLKAGLGFINKLRPVSFNWDCRDWYADVDDTGLPIPGTGVSDGSKMRDTTVMGFISQEVIAAKADETEVALDNLILDNPDKYELKQGDIIVPLVRATQELSDIIDKQQKQIDELKAMLLAK